MSKKLSIVALAFTGISLLVDFISSCVEEKAINKEIEELVDEKVDAALTKKKQSQKSKKRSK